MCMACRHVNGVLFILNSLGLQKLWEVRAETSDIFCVGQRTLNEPTCCISRVFLTNCALLRVFRGQWNRHLFLFLIYFSILANSSPSTIYTLQFQNSRFTVKRHQRPPISQPTQPRKKFHIPSMAYIVCRRWASKCTQRHGMKMAWFW